MPTSAIRILVLSSSLLYVFVETIKPVEHWSAQTGGLLFDIHTEYCCDGKIIPAQGISFSHYCCGRELINYREQTCCWTTDKVFNLTYGEHTGCCKDKIYDGRTHVCCRRKAQLAPIPTGMESEFTYFRCCKNVSFDTRSHLCCGGLVLSKWSPYSDCCGNAVYDRSSSLCCSNTIRPIQSQNQLAACCGKELHDTSTQLCCSNKIVALGKGIMACCGSRAYDKQKELCCENKIIPRKWRNAFHKCCGVITYDSSKEICCDGNVLKRTSFRTRCCGAVAYDTDENVCCDGELSKRTSMEVRCCQQSPFDPIRELCCGGRVMKKGRGTRQWCCTKDRYRHRDYISDCSARPEDLEENDEQS